MLPLIIICALGGFSLATFIYFKKKQPKPLICPIGHSCDPVVRSSYSHFMGIPVEVSGILYYLLIVLSYSALAMYPAMKTGWVELALVGFSGAAFLFSVYLTSVQAFILKEWCTWCLMSALLCMIIFFSTLQLSGVGVLGVLGELGIRN
ncbi:MAG: vitamin K epoxide reductase family protein [bacterium]|nr:vitamin K epoxide reductase family protein [bacterium]